MDKLLMGHRRFQPEVFLERARVSSDRETRGTPSTLFLTCSDSRIVPDMILQSDPGEVFVSRNAGNIVPPHGAAGGGVTATIEYAVLALKVKNIVICGHSDCSAMKTVMSGERPDTSPTADNWLRHSAGAMRLVPVPKRESEGSGAKLRLRALTRANVLTQLQHLGTHPSVAFGATRGLLRLFGWCYDIPSGTVESYDGATGRFLPLGSAAIADVTRPRRELLVS